MKLQLSYFALLLLLSGSLQAATVVSESIDSATTWTKSGSPYILNYDIRIERGALLRVEPGVRVLFGQEAKLVIAGALRAEGTQRQPIAFEGQNKNIWQGLHFFYTCDGYKEENGTGSLLRHCSFKGTGESPVTAIKTEGCNLLVEYCSFEQCYTGIEARRQANVQVRHSFFDECNRALNIRNSTHAQIEHNEIKRCNSVMLSAPTVFRYNKLHRFTNKGLHSGLVLWMASGGKQVIENNLFERFDGYAIKIQRLSRHSRINIRFNDFKRNRVNLRLSPHYCSRAKEFAISNNNFYDCKKHQVELFSKEPHEEGAELKTVHIGANYWGRLSEKELRRLTLDHSKDKAIPAHVRYDSQVARIDSHR